VIPQTIFIQIRSSSSAYRPSMREKPSHE
jgi:hypothetical protein